MLQYAIDIYLVQYGHDATGDLAYGFAVVLKARCMYAIYAIYKFTENIIFLFLKNCYKSCNTIIPPH